ncbi:MAG: PAS domain-containing protein [Polaromonas sp.]|uniref:hybrid sensor histidine kinase/response regulator n=1 Tax=Polaromonas sp. TaxID=1869339 RepID=UPI00272FC6E1|nr:PAS domain-containing protein [Polaromonas sp.]MDP2450402.1 PAS domain-containing protein [Polaromonas sp.]MDP3246803.1 PAS domain-containing protein [Polaromonas sp.]MDP3757267.1 PAS domain-containing protein [Polaromonas sp.]
MSAASDLPFLSGDTSTSRLMRGMDWSGPGLGPPQQWPQSLRSVVSLMLGSAFPMFVAWGPSLNTLYNDAYGEIMGAKHPAGMGQPFLDIWHEIRVELVPLVARAVGGEAFFMENLPLRMRRHGYDEETWFTFSLSPVRDEAGAVAGFFCACTETTGMVLAERHQRAEQERLQSLFSQAPGFIAIMRGPDHVFEIANQAYVQLTGFRDVIGKPLALALPEVVEQGFVKLLDQVFTTGEPYVGRSVRLMLNHERDAPPTEAWLDFVYQPLRDAKGAVNGVFVQGHEVTELQRIQQALLAFSNSIPAIAWVAAADGPLERFNSQWQAYTGQTAESALGNGWMAFLHPDDRVVARENWARVRGGNQEWQVDYRLRGAGGAYRWFKARAVPQLDADGRVLRWFGTTTDIEDAKKNHQALRDADRQKDEFLATLAHELRNPLAPIRAAAQLLGSPASQPAAREHAVEVIGRQVGHMARLLDDLIDVARITQRRVVLKKVPLAVDDLVESVLETVRPLAQAKRHVLVATIGGDGLQLVADPLRLAQVLSNLLNNAVKYTDEGGRIGFDVQVEVDWLSFTVTDSGIGLSQAAIENIFTMFAQEKSALDRSEGGLGIGLALAKGLVELHGGTVSAFSEGPGRGSRFVVKLPYSADRQQVVASPAATLPAPGPPQARTVLLADDNRDAVDVLAELLRMDGYLVHTANDGREAADLAMRLRPDVLVLDIGMPGLNGYEVARLVRAQPWGDRPLLIAATGWGQDDDRQKALAAGFNRHLTKPFDPQQLSAWIAEFPVPESDVDKGLP